MEELLSRYSVSDIIIFLVVISLAIKGVIEFFDWAHTRLKQKFDKENDGEEIQQALNERIEEIEAKINKRFEQDEHDIKELKEHQAEIIITLKNITDKMDILIASDKDNIKSDLTRIHHFYCYSQKWIDDYTLECCERRFVHYKKEGGNSFIEGFMQDLRSLPKKAPNNNINIIEASIM